MLEYFFNYEVDDRYVYTSREIEIIKKLKKIYKNNYCYSKVRYSHRYNKIILVCSYHGDFSSLLTILLLGTTCPKCRSDLYIQKVMNYYNL
jgi:hypothetical protein